MPLKQASAATRKPRQRNRIPLSCEACRIRKLRCNRETPCSNCLARNEQDSCTFVPKTEATFKVQRNDQANGMLQRINHLETLVSRLTSQRQNYASGHEEPLSERHLNPAYPIFTPKSASLSGTPSDSDEVRAGNTDDWVEVLKEINELKSAWKHGHEARNDNDALPSFPSMVDGTSLLFGHVKEVDRMEILASLPPKVAVAKLLNQFFDHGTFPIAVVPIIHAPTFIREYHEHCVEPSETGIVWLGLLFSILAITMLAYHQYGEPPEYEGLSESFFKLYRLRTAQCLIIGDIAKCLPYTIETLRFNATAELNRKDDNGRGLWLMTGLVVRAAVNMGYNRDPAHDKSITPMLGEYRRRVWLSVTEVDGAVSFLTGLPGSLSALPSDTLEPRNVHDSELSPNMSSLPPSRPLSDATTITYMIVKGHMVRALARITELNNALHTISYQAILDADNVLSTTYESIPSHLKMHDAGKLQYHLDTPTGISSFHIEYLFHYGMLKLHRRYVRLAEEDEFYAVSRDRCMSSALTILERQSLLSSSWYKAAQTRRFLSLAALIVLLEVARQRCGSAGTVHSSGLVQALQRSFSMWSEASGSCQDAARLHRFLTSMLSSFELSGPPAPQPSPTPGPPHSVPEPEERPRLLNNLFSDNFRTDADMLEVDWAYWDAFVEGGESSGPNLFDTELMEFSR